MPTHVLVAAALLLGSPPEDAAAHARRAEEHANEGAFDAAARELQLAYSLDPNPFYLYGLGLLAQRQGDCLTATVFFRQVLSVLDESSLDPQAKATTREATLAQLDVCAPETRVPAPTPPVDRAPPPVATSPASTPPPTPTPASPIQERPPARRHAIDRVGLGMMITGAGVTIVGGGLLATAAVVDRKADSQPTAQDLYEHNLRARNLGVSGIAVASIGGAVLIAGIIHYAVRRRRAQTHRQTRALRLQPLSFAF